MRSMRLPLTGALLFGGVLLAIGCTPDVIVMDESGQPVAGAEIIAKTLSMNVVSFTDRKGRASLPTCWVQEVQTQWGYGVMKPGYRSTLFFDLGKRPTLVTLQRDTTPQQPPSPPPPLFKDLLVPGPYGE